MGILYSMLRSDLDDGEKSALVLDFDKVLGLQLDKTMPEKAKQSSLATEEIEALIAQRDQAKAERNFIESDRIRDELANQGIKLQDTPQGTIWESE